jgi:hypothetical protein
LQSALTKNRSEKFDAWLCSFKWQK